MNVLKTVPVIAARTTAFIVALVLLSSRAAAVDLIMFDAPWCGVCRQFKAEVLKEFDSSEFGQSVSLHVVGLSEQNTLWFELTERVVSVPTFVVVEAGQETSRFSGYSNPASFYDTLAEHIGER